MNRRHRSEVGGDGRVTEENQRLDMDEEIRRDKIMVTWIVVVVVARAGSHPFLSSPPSYCKNLATSVGLFQRFLTVREAGFSGQLNMCFVVCGCIWQSGHASVTSSRILDR